MICIKYDEYDEYDKYDKYYIYVYKQTRTPVQRLDTRGEVVEDHEGRAEEQAGEGPHQLAHVLDGHLIGGLIDG